MNEWLATLTAALEGAPLAGLAAAAVLGAASVLISPCHLAGVPPRQRSGAGPPQPGARRPDGRAALRAGGLLSFAFVGGITFAAGRIAGDLGRFGNLLGAAVFIAFGLQLLGVVELPWFRSLTTKVGVAKRLGCVKSKRPRGASVNGSSGPFPARREKRPSALRAGRWLECTPLRRSTMDEATRQELVDAVGATVRRFAVEWLAPMTDPLERGTALPFALMREMGELLGLGAVAEGAVAAMAGREARRLEGGEAGQGGAGLEDQALMATVMKELSRENPGFALSFGASIGLCGQSILQQGTPAQRERWARPVLGLERIGAWALTEPEAGSDAFGLRTVARAVDGGFELTGSKTFITNAPHAEVIVVYAKLGGPDGRLAGFVVERGMAGVSVSPAYEKMGMRISPTGAIFLDQVRVGREHLLGESEEGGGRRAVVQTLLGERVALCSMALGIVEKSLEIALAYAGERRPFGQPIARFLAVQLRLARMYAAQKTVRALVEKGLRLARAGTPDLAWYCAAKYTASTLATETALEAVQVLGGNGYMTEYRVEMLARDAKLLEIGGGTSDIQLLTVARQLLGLRA